MNKFSDLVKDARKQSGLNQEELAAQLSRTKQWLSTIERGTCIPDYIDTIRLYKALDPKQTNSHSLLHWLLARAEAEVEAANLSKEDEKLVKSILIDPTSTPPLSGNTPRSGHNRTLVDFPAGFYPLSIVCGDRRESKPATRGDLLAYSLSITDLMFLPRLKLKEDVEILSDKPFLVMNSGYLKERFGQRNLLVIGSPAVNLLVRQLNKHSIFQFDSATVIDVWTKWEKHIKANPQLNDGRYVAAFWEIVQSPNKDIRDFVVPDGIPEQELQQLYDTAKALLDGKSPKDLMNSFRKPGIIDPVDNKLHAQSTRADNDFAMISIARNPYSDDNKFVAILAAGIHGPGTAHAVRCLAQKNIHFDKHPFGGVIEVRLDPFKDWPTRFETASCDWQTEDYTPEDLSEKLSVALASVPGSSSGVLTQLDRDVLQEQLELVQFVNET